jgi:nucleoid DNA-binding protein
VALTKDSIINEIYNQCSLSKTKSIEAVEFLLETIKQTLESGVRMSLSQDLGNSVLMKRMNAKAGILGQVKIYH